MPQKPLSVPLFCQNLTTVILCYQAVQINFLTNCKRSKILLQDLSSKLGSRNTSNPFLQKTHWLPVHSRIQYNISTLCYNSFSETYPLYLPGLLTVYYPSRQLRSILDTKTHIPLTKTKTFGERAFSFTGPKQWNSLPYDVRYSPSLLSFKKALRTYLFKSAYE